MSALPGHIALIAPRFAQSNVAVTDLGAHVYAGRGQWTSYFEDDIHAVLRITGRTLVHRAVRRLRDLARRIRHPQGLRRSR
jgi:hypothetical protein